MADKTDKAGRQYQALCGLFLGAIFLADLQQGVIILTVLLFLIGSLGVLSPGRMYPILLLVGVAATQLFKQFGARRFGIPWIERRADFQVEDVLICLAVLGYIVAHYRWQGIVHNILPLDRRRRERDDDWPHRVGPVVPQRRPAEHVQRKEIGMLVALLPVWPVIGQLCWIWVGQPTDLQGLRPGPARLVLAACLVGTAILLANATFGHWRRRQNSPALAAMALQDVIWKETRREQRSINRWLAWKRTV